MNIAHFAQNRHSTKAFDPTLKINDETFEQIRTLLRFSPSSVNSQPWHYVIASTEEGKTQVASATSAEYPYNEPKILNASHVVVLCARQQLEGEHLNNVLEQEDQDGRFTTEDAKQTQHGVRSFYYDLHKFDMKDTQHWIEKQVYCHSVRCCWAPRRWKWMPAQLKALIRRFWITHWACARKV